MTVEDPVAPALETVGDVGAARADVHRGRDRQRGHPLAAGAGRRRRARLARPRVRLPARRAVPGARRRVARSRSPTAATRSTCVAEDAAGNPARVERTVVADGTPPVSGPRHGQRPHDPAVVSDALSGVAGGTLAVRNGRERRSWTCRPTLRDGRLTATVPRRSLPRGLGIRARRDRPRRQRAVGRRHLDEPDARGSARARARSATPAPRCRTGARSRRRAADARRRPARPAGRSSVTSQIRQTGADAGRAHAVRTDAAGASRSPSRPGPSRQLRWCYAGGDGAVGDRRATSRCASPRARRSTRPRACSAAPGPSASPGACGRSAPSFPRAARSSTCRPPRAGAGRPSTPPAPPGAAAAWRAVARFRGTPGRYPVRLRIRREAAFGYELGYSRAVMVTVR